MAYRIGIIGCGGMASKGHGPALETYRTIHRDLELAACCDINSAKAEAFGKRFGFETFYANPDRMLDSVKLDAVCLYVTPEHTSILAVDCLSRGLPVLLEKPPGTTVGECQNIIDAHDASRLPCVVAFNRRFMPLVVEAQKHIHGCHPLRYSCTFLRNDRLDEEFHTTAIHGIDTIRFLSGCDYAHLHFDAYDLSQRGAGVRAYRMTGSLTDGSMVDLYFNQVAGVSRERIEVFAPDRSFSIDLPVGGSPYYPGKFVEHSGGGITREVDGADLVHTVERPEVEGFLGETTHFLDTVRQRPSGGTPSPTPAESLQSLEVSIALNRGVSESTFSPASRHA